MYITATMMSVPAALFQHVVEDSWRIGAFRSLKKILIASCPHVQEVDLGFLMIACASV